MAKPWIQGPCIEPQGRRFGSLQGDARSSAESEATTTKKRKNALVAKGRDRVEEI